MECGTRGGRCSTMDHELTFEVRRISSPSELASALRLRRLEYQRLGYQCRPACSDLEIDGHDASASHVGAFDATTGEIVGTVRLISGTQRADEVSLGLVWSILAERGDPALAEAAVPTFGLPSVASPRIHRLVQEVNPDLLPLCELSRSIVRQQSRGLGVSRVLLEFGFALASASGPALLVGSCTAEHVPMYARYGFREIPGDHYFPSVGQVARAVVCRTDELAEPTAAHVAGMLRSGCAPAVMTRRRTERANERASHRRRALTP